MAWGWFMRLRVSRFIDGLRKLYEVPNPEPAALLRVFEGNVEFNPAALTRLAGDAACASQFAHSLHHVGQTVSFQLCRSRVKSPAVVLHRHDQPLALPPDLQAQF